MVFRSGSGTQDKGQELIMYIQDWEIISKKKGSCKKVMLQNPGYKLSKRGLSTTMLERSHEENFGFGHWWLLETEDISKACLLLFPFCEISEQVANNGLLFVLFFFYLSWINDSICFSYLEKPECTQCSGTNVLCLGGSWLESNIFSLTEFFGALLFLFSNWGASQGDQVVTQCHLSHRNHLCG